jgi:hypothetical protein
MIKEVATARDFLQNGSCIPQLLKTSPTGASTFAKRFEQIATYHRNRALVTHIAIYNKK